ncbi:MULTISPECIES: MarR family transcriptional regulator [unclassified Exiguobacterium]|uniref:MarR family winged helix-turn-helix transcriptional regulator n=1 Tax=unclassified Exiguobacterium TaxID=2644629 RepID=UPI002E30E8BD|nr:MarR family transcriptional regulator [Exiguobacterium sp. 9-2]
MEQTETVRSTAMMQSFWNVQRHLVRAAHQTAQENGLSLPQFHSLMTIAPRGPISQKALATHTHLPKSTLSQSIEGLVQSGWVIRETNPENRREVVLSLSDQGQQFVTEIQEQEKGMQRQLEQVLKTIDQEVFEQMLATHAQIAEGIGRILQPEMKGGCSDD